MPSAWVIEVKADKTEHQHGLFEFAQVPNANDRVSLKIADQTMHSYGVIEIEHYPARLSSGDDPKEPCVAIYVNWLNEVTPK